MKKVLVTGMSGLIGGLLRSHLDSLDRYDLSALNRSFVEDVECHQADISDLEAIKPVFLNKEIVVHLSADSSGGDWNKLLNANIVGTYNVYEAARLAGVKRIVFASSCMVSRGLSAKNSINIILGHSLLKMNFCRSSQGSAAFSKYRHHAMVK